MRNGLPEYGITSPAWAEGAACPAGHWFLPEGTVFYRYDLPDSADAGPKVLLGLADKSSRRYPQDARYWDVPFIFDIQWPEDMDDAVWRTLRQRMEGLFCNGINNAGTVVPAISILSMGGVLALFVKDIECDKIVITEGRPSIVLRGTVLCCGRRIFTSAAGNVLAGPSGFSATY